jgi:large subunit ribosomal protein L7/L12
MELKQETVIEHLGNLTVMEMANLVHELEEKWGVSATPAPTIQQGAPTGPPMVEQTEFNVLLMSYGEKKINVIKALRKEIPGLGLKEAKLMAESVPGGLIKEGVSKEEADLLKDILQEAGAEVEIK